MPVTGKTSGLLITDSQVLDMSVWRNNMLLEMFGDCASSLFRKINVHTIECICRLRHKPGSISMSIGANNDDGELRQRPGYRNTEFLITTGTYTHEGMVP